MCIIVDQLELKVELGSLDGVKLLQRLEGSLDGVKLLQRLDSYVHSNIAWGPTRDSVGY